MTHDDPKLREILSDLREAHSAVVRSDRTLQQALRVSEEANRDFEDAFRLLQNYMAALSPSNSEEPK